MKKKPYSTHTPTYHSWVNMRQRCLNKKNPKYPQWGGRGIQICQRWLDSFESFVEDMGIAPKNYSIERIDNNGHYSPNNCKWATNREQSKNRRSNKYIICSGQRLSICEWAEKLGGGSSLITYRLKSGWDPISAVTIKPNLGNKYNLEIIKTK